MKKRNSYIDFLKALAIILVVWGHAIQYWHGLEYDYWHDPIFIGIYSFHMPLFALLSGYVMTFSIKKYSTVAFIKRKFKTLMIPAIFLGGGLACLGIIKRLIHGNQDYSRIPIDIVSGIASNPYWFLIATFVSLSLISVVQRVQRYTIKALIYLAIFIVSLIVPNIFNSQAIVYTLPFFVIGFYFGKWIFKKQRIATCISVLAVYVVLLLFWDKSKYIYTSGINILNAQNPLQQFLIDIYRFSIGLVGSVAFITLCQRIYSTINDKRPCDLSWIGRETESIYLLSTPVFQYSYIPLTLLQKIIHVEKWNVFLSIAFDVGLLLISLAFIKLILLILSKIEEWKWINRIFLGKWRTQ